MRLNKLIIKNKFKNFSFYYSYLKNKIFVSLILSFVVALLDGLGLAMFMPLLQLVGNDNQSLDYESLGNLEVFVNLLSTLGIELNMYSVLLIIIFFFSLKGVFKFFGSYYNVVLSSNLAKMIRIDAVNSFSNISYNYFVNVDSGKVQNTLSGEIDKITNSFRFFALAIQSVMVVIVYVILAYLTNPQFAILVSIGGALSNIIYTNLYKKTKATSKKITKGNHIFHGFMMQLVQNFKYLRSTGKINDYKVKVLDVIKLLAEGSRKIGYYNSILSATKEPLSIIVVALVIMIQVSYFSVSMGSIILSLLFFYRALNEIVAYQNNWNSFLNYSGSLESFISFISDLRSNKIEYSKGYQISQISKIEIKDGFFSYNEKPFLESINLKIEPKTTIAFVGESGSGKTTITNLLSGLLFLNKGEFIINELPIKELSLNSFQTKIGYITQEPVIFNDTLFNNITLWDEKNENNFKFFLKSIELASLNKFYSNLELKENTPLGNNGILVSGGQKQRIAIAREIYKNVDLLILDEATSALDTATEKEIQNSFEKLRGKFTMVVIAHRLSTIMSADLIYLMEDGKIVEYGDFITLQEKSTKFKKMVELQGMLEN
ncbi:MAG: ABC transporter ATP-binding protein [Mongoliitalea sp.]